MLTQSTNQQQPANGVVIFNYATKQSTEVMIANPSPYFNPVVEQAFEMVWIESLQQLLTFWTGNFDSIVYVQPYTGASLLAIFNMHDYQGYDGALEFTVSTYLEDLDTTANAAIDDVGQQIYFQCSSVNDQDDVTTQLCAHPIPTAVAAWDYINTAIAPMTYGYAAAEFVQVEA